MQKLFARHKINDLSLQNYIIVNTGGLGENEKSSSFILLLF